LKLKNIKSLASAILMYYSICNGTRRASDRKVKQAGLAFRKVFRYDINNIPATPLTERLMRNRAGILLETNALELLKQIYYSVNNRTRQAKATVGLFLSIDRLKSICYNISNIPATPLTERLSAFWAGIFFLVVKGGLLYEI